MAERISTNFNCPCCHKPLFGLYSDDGARTAGSAPLRDDEHGKYSICPNSSCKRKIRMVQELRDVWTIAPEQDCR